MVSFVLAYLKLNLWFTLKIGITPSVSPQIKEEKQIDNKEKIEEAALIMDNLTNGYDSQNNIKKIIRLLASCVEEPLTIVVFNNGSGIVAMSKAEVSKMRFTDYNSAITLTYAIQLCTN